MKRALVVLVAVSGCINFEKEYADHGVNLPSRSGVDAGGDDAGAGDAGRDAGAVDAGFDAGVDAGYCTELGCFGPVLSVSSSAYLAAALYGQPEGTLLFGAATSTFASHRVVLVGDVVTAQGPLVIDANDVGGINGAAPGASGDAFVWAESLVHLGGSFAVTKDCGLASSTSSWASGAVAVDGDGYFVRSVTEVCHWAPDAGFAPVPMTGTYVGITRWSGVAPGPGGALWFTSPDVYGVFDAAGTRVLDAPVTELRRVGDLVFAWGDLIGEGQLWVFEPGPAMWRRLSSAAIFDVWGERTDDVWVLEKQLVEGAPVLQHSLPDGGFERFAGAAYFPANLGSTVFQYLGGKERRLMLLGTDGTTGVAVELRRP